MRNQNQRITCVRALAPVFTGSYSTLVFTSLVLLVTARSGANSTQHEKTHQVLTQWGLTERLLFLDSMGCGARPFLHGGLSCLVDSLTNETLAS